MGPWNLNRIAGALAEAALGPAMWTKALDIASSETGADGAVLLPLGGDALPKFPNAAGIAGGHETCFNDSSYPRDERYSALPSLLRTGIADDFDAMPAEQINATVQLANSTLKGIDIT